MKLLNEDKSHLISKLNLSQEEKDNISTFFSSHANLESKIDWNRSDLTYEDFEKVFDIASQSKNSIKKKGLSAFKEKIDYIDISRKIFPTNKECNAFIPLTYKFQKWFQSNNEFGPEGQWCIGYQKTDDYWRSYTATSIFICLTGYNAKLMYKQKIYDNEDTLEESDQVFYTMNDMEFFSVDIDEDSYEEYGLSNEEYQLLQSLEKGDEVFEEILSPYKKFLITNSLKLLKETITTDFSHKFINREKIMNYIWLGSELENFVFPEFLYEIINNLKGFETFFQMLDFKNISIDFSKFNFVPYACYCSFVGAQNLNADLSNIDFSKCDIATRMLNNASGKLLDLSTWKVHKSSLGEDDIEVTNMFENSNFEKVILSKELYKILVEQSQIYSVKNYIVV